MGFVDKNIKKPEDIKGKTVAITPADSMTQIWPLFLKKAGLEGKRLPDRRRRRPDQAQRRHQRPGRSAARLRHGPVDEDQGRHRQGRLSDQVRRLRHSTWCRSGIIANTDYVKANADLVKRFMSATTKAVEAAVEGAEGCRAVDPRCQPEGRQDRDPDAGLRADHPALHGRRKPRASARSRSPIRT